MNDRTCIVTKKTGSSDELIRFVVGPDNQIVPDLKANLPGRGAWVSASKKIVAEAIKRKAFSRSLKTEVQVDENLPDLVEQLLKKSALGSLAMARKAGAVTSGSSKVDSAIRSHQAVMVLHASEAADDGKRKIAQAIYAAGQQKKNTIPAMTIFTGDEMSLAFGANHVIHAAILNVMAASGFIKTAQKLVTYCDEMRSEHDEMTVEAVKETE